MSIPVGPLGFRPAGPIYLLTSLTLSSLNFIDDEHLLFTFHHPQLLRRLPGDPQGEEDQVIEALTLGLPSGKVLARALWRMHDRYQYLWPLGQGKFLIRQRNTFSITDSSLQLQRFLVSPSQIVATELSPDGRSLVIESEVVTHTGKPRPSLQDESGQTSESRATQLILFDIKSKAVIASQPIPEPIELPVTGNGYLGAEAEGDHQFKITYHPFHGDPVVLGMVNSTCDPGEKFLNDRVFVIESCGPDSPDILLDAWAVDGSKLWRGRRDSHAVWPRFAFSENGSRYAVGLLRISRSLDENTSLSEDDVKEQIVQVIDSGTGSVLLTTTASPIQSAGQNFALSPDGKRLAVLSDGEIKIFDLPAGTGGSGPPRPR